MNAWSDLPNAAHIDAVLKDVRSRPEVWGAVRRAAGEAMWGAARDASWTAAQGAARDAVWRIARDVAWDEIRGAAWDAIRALIAWDESAALLDLTPDALRTIVDVADGDVKHQAVLLLPAVIVRTIGV